MSTVADELLNDFGSSGDEAEENDNDGLVNDEPQENGDHDVMDVDGDQEVSDDEEGNSMKEMGHAEALKAKVEKMQLGAVKDVRSVASLMQTLEPVLEKIEQYRSQTSTQTTNIGNIEDHPEYHLLTQSNSLSTKIYGEVALVHKFIRDHYSTRFPELERLVTTPLEYAKVVSIIGNGPMSSESIKALQTSTDNPMKMGLKAVLDGPSLMVVTVEATTSKGHELNPEELNRVRQACAMMVSLHKAKQTLTEYVQSRMNIFAPNLTALIGSLTAAQLLNAAGGLTGLSRTPACNIPSWGSKKRQAGLATNIGVRQQGYLYNSDMIRGIPNDLRKQAMRIVAAKLVLAARVDRIHSTPDGSTGDQLKSQCLERLEKLAEPPAKKGQRALPVPGDKPSRKRGGRRARKAKEAVAMTDLRKAQNRMAFGKEEQEVGYGTGSGTVGMGMIGQQNDGRIRNLQIDQRTRAKLSGKNKGWGVASTVGGAASSIGGFGQTPGSMDLRAKGLRASGVGSTIGSATGTASSLAFTPVQGLELVDPKVQAELSKKRKAEEDRWFKGGTFTQVGGASSTNGGFKVPDLPAAKRVDTGATKMGPPPPRK
ncbi:U4/U6-U5 snRNP complex subunit prp31 [Metarhizium acridum]|uniref:Pre-mRNA splicing factor n=1 Tax=Metarhizium acridum (strain CQMa 102) TaxID=655827 RepID=E9EB87_METAQ|nr:pre-mRNA splicing factor [Metarhizium acridum CQMa 102]EFY86820.1 pre-mRNA splicing factor [Metarhizium acridum CQMa 102]KAG8409524.1 U4/U6-U5 snRNP complex subunit prp31 [Metarhizium acridum]KAG8410513.1 U4/U6-U5 snRNP complex subunit prp31 [Metarhizium acridum]